LFAAIFVSLIFVTFVQFILSSYHSFFKYFLVFTITASRDLELLK